MFGFPCGKGRPPFYLNCHVYSCMLIDNNLEQRWRGTYNADTDLCLQVLAAGLCTVQFNVFMADKRQTMTQSGGNTENYKGDGRLKMARSLERVWPQVAVVGRRYNRPQHVIRYNWTRFDTPLKRDPSIDWSQFTSDNEYGMSLQAVGEIRSERLKKLIADNDS